MNTTEVQPDSNGGQEAEAQPVAKLGLLDESGLTDLLKSGFLDEKEVVPTSEEQEQEVEDKAEEDNSDADSDASSQEDESEEDHSSLSRGVQKRINKLVAAKKAAQAELEAQKQKLQQLQSELETAKATPQKPQEKLDAGVLALDTIDKVTEEHKKAVDVILWCEDNPDGGIIEMPDGKEVEVSASEVRAMKRTAIKRKEVELPARYQFLQQQETVEKEVVKDFPFFNKPETEEYRISQQIINEFPELKQKRPDWKHVVGLVVLGLQKYNETKNAKKATVPVKRAPVQPSVKAPPTVVKNDAAKAKQSFIKDTSDKNGLTDLVKAMGFV